MLVSPSTKRVGCCADAPSCSCDDYPDSNAILNAGTIIETPSLASVSFRVRGQSFIGGQFPSAWDAVGEYNATPERATCGDFSWGGRTVHEFRREVPIDTPEGPRLVTERQSVSVRGLWMAVAPSVAFSAVCADVIPSSRLLWIHLVGRMIHELTITGGSGDPLESNNSVALALTAIIQRDGTLADIDSDSMGGGAVLPCHSGGDLNIDASGTTDGTVFLTPTPGIETFKGMVRNSTGGISIGIERDVVHQTLSVSCNIPGSVIRECLNNTLNPDPPFFGSGPGFGTPVGPDDGPADRPDGGDGPGGGGTGGGGASGTIVGGGGQEDIDGPGAFDCATASCSEIADRALQLFGDSSLGFLVCPGRTDCFGGGPLPATGEGDGGSGGGPLPPDAPTGIPDSQVQGSNFNCRGCGDG